MVHRLRSVRRSADCHGRLLRVLGRLPGGRRRRRDSSSLGGDQRRHRFGDSAAARARRYHGRGVRASLLRGPRTFELGTGHDRSLLAPLRSVDLDRRSGAGRLRCAGDLLRVATTRRGRCCALQRRATTHHLRPRRRAGDDRADPRGLPAHRRTGLARLWVRIIVLIAVLFRGSDEFGSRRWFDLGFTVVQASEIGKLMTIIGLGKFLTDYRDRLAEFRIFLLSLGIAALPAGLVFIEPDAGSAVVFMALWLVMTLFAGARLRHYVTLAAIGLCLVPVGLAAGVQDYQRDRIRAFIDPESDPQGAGFNVIQAETSVGSGGLWGQGLTEGTQTQFDFVRIQTTDFIFSVLSEELGFVGAIALFLLFLLLLLRMLRVVSKAGEPLGQLLAVGMITVIAIQVFINVAINIRLIPVTGLPLPFISTGNSSLLVFFFGLGMLQSVLAWQDDTRRGPVH
ncbi:MAG: rod shape-determining protein RodA [Chloroflexi bacterium]|nr:rod shape-determining protein RodA [Chloroflexota bacterium]